MTRLDYSFKNRSNIAGCFAFSAYSKDEVKIGFIGKQPEEPLFQPEWKFAEKCAKDKGFKLVKIGAIDGQHVFAAIDNLGAQGSHGFVICTSDAKHEPIIAARAKSNDLKLISVDDRFLGSNGKPVKGVPYVGISAFNIGKDVGKVIFAEMKNRNRDIKDTALLAVTCNKLTTAKERVEGTKTALKEAGFSEKQMYSDPQKTTNAAHLTQQT